MAGRKPDIKKRTKTPPTPKQTWSIQALKLQRKREQRSLDNQRPRIRKVGLLPVPVEGLLSINQVRRLKKRMLKLKLITRIWRREVIGPQTSCIKEITKWTRSSGQVRDLLHCPYSLSIHICYSRLKLRERLTSLLTILTANQATSDRSLERRVISNNSDEALRKWGKGIGIQATIASKLQGMHNVGPLPVC